MKRKIILAVAFVAVAVLAVGATLAYFSATQTADNTFTVGNVKIVLSEPAWLSSGSIDGDTVYPGEPLAKDPTVTNTGENPCVVRIKVEWPALPEGASPITYRTNYVTGALGANWIDGGDGYFYYLKPLKDSGDTEHTDLTVATTALFNQVVMPYDLKNGDGVSLFDIKVTAEAVQAQGIFSRFAEMADGIDPAAAPAHGSPIGTGTELALVKLMFLNALGH